tara:strand:+ start:472 stop:693 length:222 start_codon:yes stop_codon:yes gene_type:complete
MKIYKLLLSLVLLVSLTSCSYVAKVKDKMFQKNDTKGDVVSAPQEEAPVEISESEPEAAADDVDSAPEDSEPK